MIWIIIHGSVLLIALIIGVRNLAIGFGRTPRRPFPLLLHKKLGFWFIILTGVGILAGYLIKKTVANNNRILLPLGHNKVFVFILIFLALLMLSGFLRSRHFHRLRWFQKLHEWFGLILLALYFAQFFGVIGRFLKLI
ncbi:MAG: hypothetical protein ABIK10_05845 [candidate division WOR-3 bacterium]